MKDLYVFGSFKCAVSSSMVDLARFSHDGLKKKKKVQCFEIRHARIASLAGSTGIRVLRDMV